MSSLNEHARLISEGSPEGGQMSTPEKRTLNEEILSFARLHPGQFTMPRLAERVSKLSGYSFDMVLAETRAMMGTQLHFSTGNTVGFN